MPTPAHPYYPPPPRPADAGTLLSGTFRTWTENFGAYFTVYLILSLILGAVSAALSFALFGVVVRGGVGWLPATSGLPTTNGGLVVLYLIGATLTTIVAATVVAGAMAEYSARRFRGERMSLEDALHRGAARFVSIFWATLIFDAIIVGVVFLPILVLLPAVIAGGSAGALLLLFLVLAVAGVVALYVAIGLSLFGPVIMIENAPAVQGLRRSWALVKGHRLSLLGALFVLAIVGGVVTEALVLSGQLAGNLTLILILTAVASAITTPWLVVLTAVAYDLLARPYPGMAPLAGTPSPPDVLPSGVFGDPNPPAAMRLPPPGG